MPSKLKSTNFFILAFILVSLMTVIIFGFILTTLKITGKANPQTEPLTNPTDFHDCANDPLVTCTN